MILFSGGFFSIYNYDNLISVYNTFLGKIKKILNQDKKLLSNNYKTYEKLINRLTELKQDNKFNIEELIDFYIKTNYFVNNYNNLLLKLEKLVYKGYINTFNIEYDTVLYIKLLLPSEKDYKSAIENSKIKKEKIGNLLLEKKCYDLIVILKYEHIASELRKKISVTVLRPENYFNLYNIQRHNIYPVSNYIKMQPDKDATIINLCVNNPIVYNLDNIKIIYNKVKGISPDYIKNIVQPIQLETISTCKSNFIIKNPNKLYETFDGIHFRKLCGDPNKFYNGPSAIANGYNIKFNEFLKNKKQKPYGDKVLLNLLKQNSIAVYSDLARKLEFYIQNNTVVIQDILNLISEFLIKKLCSDKDNNIIKLEINTGINNELFRLEKILKKSSIKEFIEFLKNDRSNILLLIEQKKKIFKFFS